MESNVFSSHLNANNAKAISHTVSSDHSTIIVFFIDFQHKAPRFISSQERQMALEIAGQLVKHDKISYRAAAKRYGLNHMTLYNYLKRTDPNFSTAQRKTLPRDEF